MAKPLCLFTHRDYIRSDPLFSGRTDATRNDKETQCLVSVTTLLGTIIFKQCSEAFMFYPRSHQLNWENLFQVWTVNVSIKACKTNASLIRHRRVMSWLCFKTSSQYAYINLMESTISALCCINCRKKRRQGYTRHWVNFQGMVSKKGHKLCDPPCPSHGLSSYQIVSQQLTWKVVAYGAMLN